MTTVKGPVTTAVDVSGTLQTTKRRTQKSYADILGRTYKSEIWDLDGGGTSPYSTVVSTFDGRDQATVVRQYSGGDTSTTYQDTTATYDGFGRLSTKHIPQQGASTYTSYNYNPDNSILDVTDARGAVSSFTYNVLGLPAGVSWSVPTSSPITVPTSSTYSYDNLGNRTAMADGLGSVAYNYNELSQMTDETRTFTDMLANAPISSHGFKLEYTYTLGGQLKSLKDPYDQQINYSYDKTGRLSSVDGAASYDGITNYASNPEYRAWGGLKHLEYGNGTKIDTTFNSRLQANHFEFTKTGVSTPLMSKDYQYYDDGKLKMADDLDTNSIWDRLI
ncbi:MAG: hypothetical protein ACRD43_09615, partial [Pyrinomonadaceae bacterium]